MATYERIPTRIEAEQFFYDKPLPRGVTPGMNFPNGEKIGAYVTTIHKQRVHLQDGDWILPEPDGEHYYPCKDEIFRKTYRLVDTE